MQTEKIGFGGSCHWCTEAIFLSLKGVLKVDQGWIAPVNEPEAFCEAVIVNFNPQIISLQTLIAIHLHTHSCTSNHTMRTKYRSAIYNFTNKQKSVAQEAIEALQPEFDQPIITEVLSFGDFKINSSNYLNYYYSDPRKPFCENVINPKLRIIIARFRKHIDDTRIII